MYIGPIDPTLNKALGWRPGGVGDYILEFTPTDLILVVWLADNNTEVLILMAPLWYVQTHGIPLNWQRLRLLICTAAGGERTPISTVPMSP